MPSWYVRRVLSSLLLVVVLASAVFFVVRLAPGDPLDRATAFDSLGDHERALMRERLGLDRPLAAQYASWLGGLVKGDPGTGGW